MPVLLRPMSDGDLDEVFALQAVAYPPELHEARATIAGRLRLCAEGCWVATTGAAVVGYMISHPWVLGDVPLLDTPLDSLPDRCDCYYVHDVCVRSDARRGGAARALVAKAFDAAHGRGLATLCLTAVQGSVPIWERFGFRVREDLPPAFRSHLGSYGASARYMTREEA